MRSAVLVAILYMFTACSISDPGRVKGVNSVSSTGGTSNLFLDALETAFRAMLRHTDVTLYRTGDEIVLTMPGAASFAVDAVGLKPEFEPLLESIAGVLNAYPATVISVVGHTDGTGAPEYNMDLSQRRAERVAAYLVSRGIEPLRILTQGLDPHFPVADNATAEGRQRNRRVELVLTPIVG